MVNRVIIDSTASSPLRVSVAGVDASLAEFNNLIFDGNQSPLRLSSTGYASAGGISYSDYQGGKNINEGSPVIVVSSPSGTTPIWLCLQTLNNNNFLSGVGHVNTLTSGTSCAICQSSGVNYFIPCCHEVGIPSFPTSPGQTQYLNYAIMKNWT